jgi:hypothetical protein
MSRLDFECPICTVRRFDVEFHGEPHVSCSDCQTEMEVLWSSPSSRRASVHPSERAVVFENPQTGEVKYPPRNDMAPPSGFVRRELSSLQEGRQFAKEHNVKWEISEFDRGSGRGFDTELRASKLTPEMVHAVLNGSR